MAGFPLTGVDPADPTPGLIREIKFEQGASSAGGSSRPVVLMGNKLSAGSETTNTLGTAINDLQDAVDRFGYRSELLLMYRTYTAVDPTATVYAIAIPEGGGATASAVDFTIATTSTDVTSISFMCIGETITVPVALGDTVTTQAAALKLAINSQIFWPITADNVAGVLTCTASNVGPRGDLVTNQLRASYTKSAGSTITKGSITPGATADSNTTALALFDNADIYYQVSAAHTTSAPTSSDHGVGEHIAKLVTLALPANGKNCVGVFGFTGTQAQATTVATASAANSSLAFFYHAKNNDWTPAMIAAHCAGVMRAQQIANPAANLTDYGKHDGDILRIPDPYTKTNRLTPTEIKADLNNGVTPIAFTQQGQAYMVRQITSRSLTGTVNDYRVREGHIPSVMHYFWDTLKIRYFTTAQDFVADDPKVNEKPIPGFTYPGQVKTLVSKLIDDECDAGHLDPSFRDDMKAGVEVRRLTDGISVKCRPIAVKHNNKGQFLILESSEAY